VSNFEPDFSFGLYEFELFSEGFKAFEVDLLKSNKSDFLVLGDNGIVQKPCESLLNALGF